MWENVGAKKCPRNLFRDLAAEHALKANCVKLIVSQTR